MRIFKIKGLVYIIFCNVGLNCVVNAMKPRIRVMHIDDEESFLDLVKAFFSNLYPNILLESCSSPIDALRRLEYGTYTAIICDYQMPNLSGLQILSKLRDAGNSTPFIILTGKGREEVVIDALNLGADYYFQKSEHFKSLVSEIGNIVLKEAEKKLEKERRQLAEKEIQASEIRFQTIFEQSPISMQICSPEGQTKYVNKAFKRSWGLTMEDYRGTNIFENSQLVKQGAIPYIKKGFTEGPVTIPNIEAFVPEPDSADELRKVTIRMTIYPIKDINGFNREVVIVHEDVTQTKQMKDALKESEQKLQNIIDFFPNGITLMNEQGILTEWNWNMESITGYKKADVIGKSAWEVYWMLLPEEKKTPETIDRIKMLINQGLKTGQNSSIGQYQKFEIVKSDEISQLIEEFSFSIKTSRGYMICTIIRTV